MSVELRAVAGWFGVLTSVTFVAGIVLMASEGVESLIPETGAAAETWARQVDGAGGQFVAGGWLIVAGGLFALVALIGFHDTFRGAAQWLHLAPVLAVVAMTLVTVSHVVALEVATNFVPAYVAANDSVRSSLAVSLQTWAGVSLGLNLTGDIVLWGVVVPMYAVATLRSHVVAHWIGWLGLFTAMFGGWLGFVGVFVKPLEGFTFLGFVAFFVWIASMGVAMLRSPVHRERSPSAHAG